MMLADAFKNGAGRPLAALGACGKLRLALRGRRVSTVRCFHAKCAVGVAAMTLGGLVMIPLEELRAILREIVREELNARLTNAVSNGKGVLSVAEAAQAAHRHVETIRRAIHRGTLRASKPEAGREWVIEATELQRWMNALTPQHSIGSVDMAEIESIQARARELLKVKD